MMPGKMLVLIVGAVGFSALGQLLLKSGARHPAGLGRLEFLLAAVQNVRVLFGLVAWMTSTVCRLYVLRVAALSRVYGLTSVTYVHVPLVSAYVFGEQIGRLQLAGMLSS
jgi:hypothetical protein